MNASALGASPLKRGAAEVEPGVLLLEPFFQGRSIRANVGVEFKGVRWS
jgi:hypothetical protein